MWQLKKSYWNQFVFTIRITIVHVLNGIVYIQREMNKRFIWWTSSE